ncbi:PRC-barrel domain-containing protein [Neobacillus muris]|uniref:PRC-barrel domain-containing protein n=1 Tax=Neobacillus muris TaxID=2941334 RepID=UPI00203C19F1|nr:PRC-barrel domain-containing protein [Neobacillus muris]
MKNSKQIGGLPIINISDGNQLGKVKSLVINPDKGSIDFLTIEHEDWQVSVKAIPYKKVVGIGEFAVTIESENAVIDLNEIPIANQLVNKKIKIVNTRVMTRKGELIGVVNEYYVDQETGDILGMELTVGNKQVAIASEQVVTFGKDIIIVKEDSSSHFLQSIDQLDGNEYEAQSTSEKDEVSSLLDEVQGENSGIFSLKLKQIELLKGKKLISDIYGKDGSLLFRAGTVLTPENVEKAQEEGPGTIVELSMNVEV